MRFLRTVSGLSQLDLGQKAGVSQACISRIESGDFCAASEDMQDRIAKILKSSREELFSKVKNV